MGGGNKAWVGDARLATKKLSINLNKNTDSINVHISTKLALFFILEGVSVLAFIYVFLEANRLPDKSWIEGDYF